MQIKERHSMKKTILLTAALLITIGLFSQVPQAFQYQAVVHDEAGNLLINRDIGVRVNIVPENNNGTATFSETHRVTSNSFGMINLVIGEGSREKGEFSDINWGEGSYYIKMEMDVHGGTDYKEVGTTQLLAVPYALYAEQAGSVLSEENPQEIPEGTGSSSSSGSNRTNGTPNTKLPADGNSHLNVNAGKVGIGTTDPQEKLDVEGTVMSSDGYNINGSDGLDSLVVFVSEVDFDDDTLTTAGHGFNGGILTFVCGDTIMDSRDGKKYGTVLIGNQCWMSENMNIGTIISSGSGGNLQKNNDTIEKYCINNDQGQCDIYGGMYEVNEAMQYVYIEGTQGICPNGWHIPSDDEWKILEGTVDSFYPVGDPVWDGISYRGFDAGDNLKTISGWTSNNGTDLFGFSALPAGRRDQETGNFYLVTSSSIFWVSRIGISSPMYRSLGASNPGVARQTVIPTLGYDGRSIRCIRD